MQNLIPLVREVEEKPTNENLNRFKTAVEETNQFLSKLENELIIENVNTVLSVDLGRVATKCCISRDPGNVMFISANVKQMSMEQLRGGVFQTNETDPLMDLWLEYQGEGYAVGALAAKFGANLGVGQSKVEYAIVKVLASAGYFKLKGNIAIVISLPYHFQEEFDKEKALLINQLIGTHVMTFRGELVELNVGKVWIMPDGYGSLLWCEAQPKKGRETTDFTKLSVAIVDIGHETTDCVMVDNFRFARGASKSEKFSMNNFYELIAEEIEGADIQSLHLIAAVNKPRGERLYRPRGASKPTNLDDFLPHLIEMFSREICSRILAWLPERVTDVILTGGGGEFFWEDVQRVLKEAQINAHLAAPSRQANVLGQYIYGEAQLSASRVKPKQKV
ncbi:MAG: ParM/StbA family protein [Cyanobacteria bacterium P01_A01_bin.84]